MVIRLNGTYYHYCEIDSGTVSSLLGADSMGRAIATPALATPPSYECGKIGVDVLTKDENGVLFFGPLDNKTKLVYVMADAKNINDATKKRLPARLFRWKRYTLYYRGKRCVI